MQQRFSLTKTVGNDDPATACDFLARLTGLSKSRIKDAMSKGAVWLKKTNGRRHRLRRASTAVKPGDSLSINYDDRLLAMSPRRPDLISDQHRYSVWYKPAGLMTQGTVFGDHCSLLRLVELFFRPRREVFPIHRIDREAAGIVLIAHDKKAAAALSGLFVSQKVIKRYRARVLGDLASAGPRGIIDRPVDGKPAVTEYTITGYNPTSNSTAVDIIIQTGRKHQIRRHFEAIGFPVIGDPRYGKDNKNRSGLKLMATELAFRCPFSEKSLVFKSPHSGFEAGT